MKTERERSQTEGEDERQEGGQKETDYWRRKERQEEGQLERGGQLQLMFAE